jgi:hypothetical protein
VPVNVNIKDLRKRDADGVIGRGLMNFVGTKKNGDWELGEE